MAEDQPKTKATRKRRAAQTTPAKPAAKAAATAASETEAAPNREDQAPPPETGSRRPVPLGLIGALAAIVVVGAVVLALPGARNFLAGLLAGPELSAPSPAPKPAPWTELADRLGALERSVAEMRADIEALKSAPPPAREGDGAAQRAIEERLAALASSVEAMEGRLAKPAPAPEESGTLALMALAGALRHGTAFAPLAARVRGDFAERGGKEGLIAALDGLAAYAATGVPTRDSLAARLEDLRIASPKGGAPPARVKSKPQRATGFWDKVKSNLAGLVKIRRTAGQKDQAADPAARARTAAAAALAKRDLGAAVAASAGLTGPEAEAWRKDVRARIAANGLARALDRAVAERLGPKAAKP